MSHDQLLESDQSNDGDLPGSAVRVACQGGVRGDGTASSVTADELRTNPS